MRQEDRAAAAGILLTTPPPLPMLASGWRFAVISRTCRVFPKPRMGVSPEILETTRPVSRTQNQAGNTLRKRPRYACLRWPGPSAPGVRRASPTCRRFGGVGIIMARCPLCSNAAWPMPRLQMATSAPERPKSGRVAAARVVHATKRGHSQAAWKRPAPGARIRQLGARNMPLRSTGGAALQLRGATHRVRR